MHLFAYDPPVFVEVPAAVVLASIAWATFTWLLRRSTRADAIAEAKIAASDAAIEMRIVALETKVTRLENELERERQATSDERHAKHEAMSKAAAYHGTLKVVKHIVAISDPADIANLLSPLLAEVS